MRRALFASLTALTLLAAPPAPPKTEAERLYNAFREVFDGDPRPEAASALAALEKAAPGDPLALDARKRFDAPAKTLPGKAAPAFRVANLENPGESFSLETFKGKYVLLEFWATWCPYCVAELPEIHKAWDRFKGRNFEILSFSLDKKPQDVAPFRKHKQPMPWKHAWLEGAKLHPVAEAYGAAGIPKYVLVAPDGTIAAAGPSLRGARLEPTLETFLGK